MTVRSEVESCVKTVKFSVSTQIWFYARMHFCEWLITHANAYRNSHCAARRRAAAGARQRYVAGNYKIALASELEIP